MTPRFSELSVTADTHRAGYSLHKYWARKPHNVVRAALEACRISRGDVVLDPLCGSGLPLSEAAALGARCVGFDSNPIAVELSQVTLNPPDPGRYREALTSTLETLERRFSKEYRVGGRALRYAVHATIVECAECGLRVSADRANRKGRTYLCPACSSRLCFNLEHLVGTRLLRAVLDDGSAVELGADIPRSDASAAARRRADQAFAANARILAYPGLRTSHLFTPRNFEVLAAFGEAIDGVPEDARPAARLTLTSSAAQCSRLIAHRNDLTTGGPAWTVPGFWVPPIHLETNPLAHIRARMQRLHRGLLDLRSFPGRGAHRVLLGDARTLLRSEARGLGAKVAFLDPPYGDSVPYLEFSAMWNSFLGRLPPAESDIAVSDRAGAGGSWDDYARSLKRIVADLAPALRSDGLLVVTFNNRDLRAWRALLRALQDEGFGCEGAFYQHPAVVSAKAQLARDGSYVGDFYAAFRQGGRTPRNELGPVREALRRAVPFDRDHPLDVRRLERAALTAWLRENISAELLDSLEVVVRRSREEGATGTRGSRAARAR
jgi:SAM-dependent methyltransferase